MIDINQSPDHHVQRYILDKLRHNEFCRFRDMRPAGVDSNAYSYHLTLLRRQQYVSKTAEGYTLSLKGLAYIDRVSALDTRPRRQPKIMTISAIFNEHGEVLVRRKTNQPMINQWTLPCGMLHMDDDIIHAAAVREVYEKFGLNLPKLHHAGDCYMAIRNDGKTIMNALMHVFTITVQSDEITIPDDTFWAGTTSLEEAAPATRNIIMALTRQGAAGRFFLEFSEDL